MKDKIKFAIISLPVTVLIILIMIRPEETLQGGIKGILTVGNIIIPSLLPFTALSLFLYKSGVLGKISYYISPVTHKLLRLNGIKFCVFFVSLISGYPIGVKMISEMYNKQIIDIKEARKMCCYCINAGPSFILTAVGVGIYKDRICGIILLTANTLGAVISAFFTERKSRYDRKKLSASVNIAEALTESVADASSAILILSGWIIIFSSILSVIKTFCTPKIYGIISAVLEVTNAVSNNNKSLTATAFIIAFGGLSVHCQIFSMLGRIDISYFKFLLSRFIHGLISASITRILVIIFKPSVAVMSNISDTLTTEYSSTLPFAVTLVILSVMLILSINNRKEYQKLL